MPRRIHISNYITILKNSHKRRKFWIKTSSKKVKTKKMNKKEKIEQKIRKTLDQFDHAEQLPPNPYFYTRVQARLEETRRQQNVICTIL